jgi:NADP-dependent 3-hydroxy acid dehydrogenase YdfG
VVTGASSGIGAEIARCLHERGHHVTLVARSADRLEALAAELSPDADVLVADLADRATRAALPGRVAANGRVVDVLVNNAGFSTMGPVSASDPEVEMGMIGVDVVAVADLCSRLLPGMVERGRAPQLHVDLGSRRRTGGRRRHGQGAHGRDPGPGQPGCRCPRPGDSALPARPAAGQGHPGLRGGR